MKTMNPRTPSDAGRGPRPDRSTRCDRCGRLVLAFRAPTVEAVRQLPDWHPGDLVRLQTEYTRLFVNAKGGPVAPLEAVCWLAGDGVAAQTDYLSGLLGAYAVDGVAVDRESGLPPDHLSVLLEFLRLLENRADQEGPGLEMRRDEADTFVSRFLTPWIPRFLATLEAADTVSFYRKAARELETLVISRA